MGAYHIRRFIIESCGEGLAVADILSNRVDLLNGSAALTWLYLEEGPFTTDDIARQLARIYGLDHSDVAPALIGILEQWKMDGWLSQSQDGSWSISQMPSVDAGEFDNLHPDMKSANGDGRVLLWCRNLVIYDKTVLLSVWGTTEFAFSADIERLRGFLSGIPDALPRHIDAEVSVIFGRSGVAVKTLQNAHVFPTFVEASATLHSLLIRAVAALPNGFTTLHAAAVSKEQGTILMPAVSGSGKTTLTAYLVQRGWRYGGDDLVGVKLSGDAGALELCPYPTAMGIKQGSLAVLEALYPHIHGISPTDYGQKTARFLPVESDLWTPNTGNWRNVRALVFPQYQAEAECDLEEATQEEALRAVLEAGIGTYAKAESGRFELLFELIRVTPSYRMRYSKLAEADQHLASLMS